MWVDRWQNLTTAGHKLGKHDAGPTSDSNVGQTDVGPTLDQHFVGTQDKTTWDTYL